MFYLCTVLHFPESRFLISIKSQKIPVLLLIVLEVDVATAQSGLLHLDALRLIQWHPSTKWNCKFESIYTLSTRCLGWKRCFWFVLLKCWMFFHCGSLLVNQCFCGCVSFPPTEDLSLLPFLSAPQSEKNLRRSTTECQIQQAATFWWVFDFIAIYNDQRGKRSLVCLHDEVLQLWYIF